VVEALEEEMVGKGFQTDLGAGMPAATNTWAFVVRLGLGLLGWNTEGERKKKIKRNKTKTIFGSCDCTYYHERPVFRLTIRVRYFGPSAVLKLIFARDLLASDV
jgi:hypothetical protein